MTVDEVHRTGPAMPAPARRGPRRVPLFLFLPAGLALAFLVLPLLALLLRAPWGTLLEHLAHPAILAALRLSLLTATLATAVCVLLGVPLAWLLARVEFPGRRL